MVHAERAKELAPHQRVRWSLRRWVGGAEGSWALPPSPSPTGGSFHGSVPNLSQAAWSPETPRPPRTAAPDYAHSVAQPGPQAQMVQV